MENETCASGGDELTMIARGGQVVTPFRWSHEAGAGQGYNILPGHSYAVPTKDGNDRSLSSVLASSSA